LGDLDAIDLASAAARTPVPLRFTGVRAAWLTSLFCGLVFNIQDAEVAERKEIARATSRSS
jgi:hypothetical protein